MSTHGVMIIRPPKQTKDLTAVIKKEPVEHLINSRENTKNTHVCRSSSVSPGSCSSSLVFKYCYPTRSTEQPLQFFATAFENILHNLSV